MYGKTVNASTFMDRVANHSTKGSRRGFVDVDTGVSPADIQTLAQRRDNLVRKRKALEARREEAKRSRLGKAEYQRLGIEIFEIQNELRSIRGLMPKVLAKKSFDYYFNVCARSSLPGPEYDRLCEAARRMMLEVNAPAIDAAMREGNERSEAKEPK